MLLLDVTGVQRAANLGSKLGVLAGEACTVEHLNQDLLVFWSVEGHGVRVNLRMRSRKELFAADWTKAVVATAVLLSPTVGVAVRL